MSSRFSFLVAILSLLGTAGFAVDSGLFHLSASELGDITITTNGPSVDTTPNNTRTVLFTIHWTGPTNGSNMISYSVDCTGAATCNSQSNEVLMSKNTPVVDVSVTYTTGSAGNGSVTMVAEGANAPAEASIPVVLSTAFELVPVSAILTVYKPAGQTGSGTATYTITNQTSATIAFALSCTFSAGTGSCPSSIQLAGSASGSVAVPFSGVASSSNVVLTGTAGSTTHSGTYQVTAEDQVLNDIAVSVNGPTTIRLPSGSGPFSAEFVLSNTGPTAVYTLSCNACTPSSSQVTIPNNQSVIETVSFSTGSPGWSTITLTASKTGDSDSATIQLRSGGGVAALSGTSPISATPQSTNNTATVTITNSGEGPNYYTITCIPSGSVAACTPPASAVLLPYQGSAQFDVHYNAGASGSGLLQISAASADDNASMPVSVNVSGGGSGGSVAVSPDGSALTVAKQTTGAIAAFKCAEHRSNGSYKCLTDSKLHGAYHYHQLLTFEHQHSHTFCRSNCRGKRLVQHDIHRGQRYRASDCDEREYRYRLLQRHGQCRFLRCAHRRSRHDKTLLPF